MIRGSLIFLAGVASVFAATYAGIRWLLHDLDAAWGPL